MSEMVSRVVERALGRIRLAFRSVLTAVDSKAPIQLLQGDGMAGEQLQDNELMQHYGFTSVPKPGTQLVVLPIGGRTAHGIVIATEHTQYRLKALKNGEVAIYDDQGQQIVLTRSGIVVKGAGQPVTITDTPHVNLNTNTVRVTGDLIVDGDVAAKGNVQSGTAASGSITTPTGQVVTVMGGSVVNIF